MDAVIDRKAIPARLADSPSWCSDFDTDCAGVMDHAACHRGGLMRCRNGVWMDLPPADGPCPYLPTPALHPYQEGRE